MKKIILILVVLFSLQIISVFPEKLSANADFSDYSVRITEVGSAALCVSDIEVLEYPHAYKIEFFDKSEKPVVMLQNPVAVYLPYGKIYGINPAECVSYLMAGDKLITTFGRFIEQNNVFELFTDKSGIYVIKSGDKLGLGLDDIDNNEVFEALAMRDIILPSSSLYIDTESPLKRIEFFEIISRILQLKGEYKSSRFSDIPKGSLLLNDIEAAADLGIVKGADGMFMPNKLITRAEAAVILSNTLKYVTGFEACDADMGELTYNDISQIPNWAKLSVWAVSNKYSIIPKTEEFEPSVTVNPTELANMIFNLLFKAPIENLGKYPIAFGGELVSMAGKTKNGVTAYPSFPNSQKSSAYILTANGVEVFVESKAGANIARFESQSGVVSYELTCNDDIKGITISPLSLGIAATVSKNKAVFSAPAGQKLFVQVGNSEHLIISSDLPETDRPSPSDPKVIDISRQPGVDSTGKSYCTEAIQKVLDKASEGGNTVYFKNGRYTTGPLDIKSNTKIYLEPGAIIYGGSEFDDFAKIYTQNGKSRPAFINIFDASDVKIFGRGAIDQNGGSKRLINMKFEKRLLLTANTKNLIIKDVNIWDSAFWNTHFYKSSDILVDNINMLNNINVINTDGIDPDYAHDVTVTNSFFYCDDDPMCIKSGTRNSYALTDSKNDFVYNITFANNLVYTHASAMKLGTAGTADKTFDIVFENNDIINCDRAVAVYTYENTAATGIYWVNNRIERISFGSRGRGNDCVFMFELRARDSERPLTANTTFADSLISNLFVRFNGGKENKIYVQKPGSVRRITFENIYFNGKKVTEESALHLDVAGDVSDIIIK